MLTKFEKFEDELKSQINQTLNKIDDLLKTTSNDDHMLSLQERYINYRNRFVVNNLFYLLFEYQNISEKRARSKMFLPLNNTTFIFGNKEGNEYTNNYQMTYFIKNNKPFYIEDFHTMFVSQGYPGSYVQNIR